MRPGWLRVDVFDRGGDLQYILTQPAPEFNTEYFPTDLAVRILSDIEIESGGENVGVGDSNNASGVGPGSGTVYELAVSVYKPEARIDRFRWRE